MPIAATPSPLPQDAVVTIAHHCSGLLSSPNDVGPQIISLPEAVGGTCLHLLACTE